MPCCDIMIICCGQQWKTYTSCCQTTHLSSVAYRELISPFVVYISTQQCTHTACEYTHKQRKISRVADHESIHQLVVYIHILHMHAHTNPGTHLPKVADHEMPPKPTSQPTTSSMHLRLSRSIGCTCQRQ